MAGQEKRCSGDSSVCEPQCLQGRYLFSSIVLDFHSCQVACSESGKDIRQNPACIQFTNFMFKLHCEDFLF